mmetsp:Transcript_19691/g.27282  ORF Transcript_19691/g.27282 Transcript_19691/m.27282 type:complete len:225 (-) Transcript_19691:867-1541(-)
MSPSMLSFSPRAVCCLSAFNMVSGWKTCARSTDFTPATTDPRAATWYSFSISMRREVADRIYCSGSSGPSHTASHLGGTSLPSRNSATSCTSGVSISAPCKIRASEEIPRSIWFNRVRPKMYSSATKMSTGSWKFFMVTSLGLKCCLASGHWAASLSQSLRMGANWRAQRSRSNPRVSCLPAAISFSCTSTCLELASCTWRLALAGRENTEGSSASGSAPISDT